MKSENWTPTIHRPGQKVTDSGIYDVVDEHGVYLNHQETFSERKRRKNIFSRPRDPRAFGYVLRIKTIHVDDPEPTQVHHPGNKCPDSGIYEVVDEHGNSIGTQKTCRAGTKFPPMIREGAFGYVLHYKAAQMPAIFRRGEAAPDSGVYAVVDREGLALGRQVNCSKGESFPEVYEPCEFGFVMHRVPEAEAEPVA